VDDDKKRMLRVMARAFLRRCDDAEKIQTRFDVVSVYLLGENAEFEVTKGAFAWA
jgi:Holliday junction resolvase-like predicted endonuclease